MAAAYDDALTLLNDLRKESTGRTATEVAQYQAFCLLALERVEPAKKVIEELVRADPAYRLPETQASPRIHRIFQDVRRAVLPAVVQRSYTEAKDAFDRRDPTATAQFDVVLSLIEDPDMRGALSSDFRTVVTGFRDLSRAAGGARAEAAAAPAALSADSSRPTAAHPAPPSAPAAALHASAAPSTPPAPVRPAPGVADQPTAVLPSTPSAWIVEQAVYDPPTILSKPMPRWVLPNGAAPRNGFNGRLAIQVDEQGFVVSAILEAPIYPGYDEELLRLARTWRFTPAKRNGVPIPFSTVVEIRNQRVLE